MIKPLLSIVLLSLLLESPVREKIPEPIDQRNPNQVTISFVRSDGVVVPFAVYEKGKWLNPWLKSPDASAEEPNTIAGRSTAWFAQDRTLSSTWYFWSLGGAVETLKTSKIVQIENHCQTEWGLQTELPKEVVKSDRYGMIGLALDKRLKVEPTIDIDQSSDEWGKLRSFIQANFDRQEESKAAELSTFLKPPARDEEKNVSVTLSHLYRSGALTSGRYLYYFEALKEYDKPLPSNPASCNNIFFRGWVVAKSGEDLKLVDAQIGWTGCEVNENRVPLGTLEVDNQVFVVSLDLGYEDESYSIFKLGESGISLVLETGGGSC